MNLESLLLGKSFAANITREWPFTCREWLVFVGSMGGTSKINHSMVKFQYLTCMRLHVSIQRGLLGEAVAAELARELGLRTC